MPAAPHCRRSLLLSTADLRSHSPPLLLALRRAAFSPGLLWDLPGDG
eukprot:CAMPEP_0118964470 /NCGR_PEP_ID=MMETSP1173-20130426/2144_1 /TAXON_ID=1034831 /ORGANISM="Rhizochromulina marina cf, Strain CCMP1243" /LENGTH=46 /DNA_ID= /DNA_START= /DNA_END= /DNA_ORIENTATION=